MSETWGWAPLIALMFVGALGSIGTDIFNAAKIDGATNWEVFRHITLPLLKPVILIVTLLKTIFSLKMFDQVVTMTGGGPGKATQTINYYIYQIGLGEVWTWATPRRLLIFWWCYLASLLFSTSKFYLTGVRHGADFI